MVNTNTCVIIFIMIRRIFRKKKHSIPLFALLLMAIFLGWMLFGVLVIDDIKGKSNTARKILFDISHILPSRSAIKLAVPYHKQEHALSCEVAALLMALKYRDVKVTESQLIEQLPFSDTGSRRQDNTWGDPDIGFVGNIDGRMPNTGYGVYEKPIYELAKKYRDAKIMTGSTLDDLIQELINDNPVVVWGVIGHGKDISWKTPEGKDVYAHLDEHARTLVGYTGDSNNPKSMILLDPIYGEISMSVKDFLANWELLEKKAVAIY